MRYIKIIIKAGLLFAAISLISIIGANKFVEKSAEKNIYNSTEEIPYNKVGLLLGTRKILPNGQLNLYYKYRIDAAVKLFNSGKVDFILVSGDNSTKDYDEPSTIKDDLISQGIPANRIFLDYAGFRTLDSIVRSKKIFSQDSITVISQQFHNERAICIANRKDVKAIGFNAKDVGVYVGFKTQVREKLARVKMILDLTCGKKPKFLGPKIEIK